MTKAHLNIYIEDINGLNYIVVLFNLSENHCVAVGVSFGTAHGHVLKLYH